ncbi:DHH family phosphoesterase [Limosilactobacillus equigenerosi]|uniref:Phosphoesterase domain-containing protein n=1 Tax=Limosilactobacillus equigenerosi DSM 18793 = JCM 14505 TaxID=1423742 RepID=A0A0R1UY33_9LACO|nr:bifunctional oligoribonuclease/PAP phosphatase NrnA [Limosilactobacillus equigenerosi]KRL96410.1 Phosphoesterase domain-containing protein [Limosilactobacillus equigenerosi DSM 18793 = JCM 14505]
MDELTQILQAIQKYNRIIIHRHQRPDPDAIGSQVGLAAIIKASFPHKEVSVVGKDIPSFDWIGTMDDIDGADFQNALVIVLDTANAPRIDDRRFDQGDQLIKIDHHPNDEPYGDVMFVNEQASSTSEIIYDFYHQFQAQLTLPGEAANALYAGIIGDTGRFLYPATTGHTLQVAGALIEAGAQAEQISRKEDEISWPLAKLSADVYQNLAVNEAGVAWVTLTMEHLEQLGISESGTSAVVPLPGKIHDVKAWAIFLEQNDGSFRVRLRSKQVVINTVAKLHQGGGHPLASGARAKDQAECEQIVAELTAACMKEK